MPTFFLPVVTSIRLTLIRSMAILVRVRGLLYACIAMSLHLSLVTLNTSRSLASTPVSQAVIM